MAIPPNMPPIPAPSRTADARAAFFRQATAAPAASFEAAVTAAQAAPSAPAAPAAPQRIVEAPRVAAAPDPTRPLRPGSLLDIRV